MKEPPRVARTTPALRRTPQPVRFALACATFAAAAGCYTTTNTVTLAPLRTHYPVSASPQYVDAQGKIVTDEEYDVVQSFEFERKVEAPRHDDTESSLKLEAELDRALAQSNGDAITEMSVYASDYDPGSHGSAAGWKIMGWTFGLTGLTFVGLGAAMDSDVSGTFFVVGGVMAGLGAVSYLLGSAANDPATWTLNVKGQVVKRKAGSTALEPAAAPASPDAAAPAPDAASPAPPAPATAVPAAAEPAPNP